MKQPDACVVRITNAKGETQGTGFLVSTDGLIATCAHLLEGTEPCVAFPGGEPCPARIVSVDEAQDVVFLRLTPALPENIIPAELAPSVRLEGAAVRAFGYPKVGDIEGLWGVGQLVGYVTEAGKSLLQLSSTQITKGFSGGPVWDTATGRVLGMVVQIAPSDRYGKLEDVAFAVPTETLRALCPEELVLHYTLPPGVPFQAPVIPRYFVPRPEVSNDLKARLLADEATTAGALVVSAVHGLGGIGKTTLIAALAHDPTMQARFSNGFLWVTLGQQPDVLSLLVGWVQALGDYYFRPTVIESASAHLRTLLHDKACLLVVDDAWQADHVRPFLVGGDRCWVLVTTRDATLARKVGARLYDLDVMTEAQALALFEARLGSLNGDREQAAALARELGYLPLALELAAAQVEGGYSWDGLLDAFRQGLADLAALDLDEATYRNESLRLSFHLSLERLSPEDQGAFTWLGVLPEDARINPTMAVTLWDQSEIDARKRLRRLRDKALLTAIDGGQYTVHDLLHHEAQLQLKERMSLREAHATLLARYRARTQQGLWHTLPDDGYIHDHLAWHMEQAGQIQAIHTLVCEETPEGRNGWFEVRERLGQTAGFLADVVHAWRLADEEFDLCSLPLAIGLQCRYAIMVASFNSLAQSIPVALLIALVDAGFWAISKGLAYARQVPDPEQRAEALLKLATHLPETERAAIQGEALTAVREIKRFSDRAKTLARLVSHLPESLLQEALEVAREIKYAPDRLLVLTELVPRLPKSMLQEVQADVKEIHRTETEYYALRPRTPQAYYVPYQATLAALATRLAEVGDPANALSAARDIQNVYYRAKALLGIVPHLPEPLKELTLKDALRTAQKIGPSWDRAEVLVKLTPFLPESLLQEALEVARRIEARYRAKVLARLATFLSEAERTNAQREALAAAQDVDRDNDRATVLAELIPHLPETLQERVAKEALAVARNVEGDDDRATSLAELVPYLSEDLQTLAIRETLTAVHSVSRGFDQAILLAKIACHLPKALQEQSLKDALAITRKARDGRHQALALSRLALQMPRALREQALQGILAMVQEIGPLQDRVEALAKLAPHLPRSLLKEALAAARGIRDEHNRAKALAGLVPHLPELLLQEVLVVTRHMGSTDYQADVLVEALPKLAELGSSEGLLTMVRNIGSESRRAETLARMAPWLPESLLQEALMTAREIHDDYYRIKALTELVPRLPETVREQVLKDTLATARGMQHGLQRAEALTTLAPHLPESLMGTILVDLAPRFRLPEGLLELGRAGAWVIQNEHFRTRTLIGVAPYLPETLLGKALVEARAMEYHRAEALAGIIPRLVELGHSTEALEVAQQIEKKLIRAEALAGLALRLPETLATEVLREALAEVRKIQDTSMQAKALAELVPCLAKLGYSQEALVVAREIRDMSIQAKTLAWLVPWLAKLDYSQEALTALREIQDADIQAKALTELVFHLTGSSSVAVYPIWCQTLHALSISTRARLLSEISMLAPVIATLGGDEAIAETFRAIQDVGRWWP